MIRDIIFIQLDNIILHDLWMNNRLYSQNDSKKTIHLHVLGCRVTDVFPRNQLSS